MGPTVKQEMFVPRDNPDLRLAVCLDPGFEVACDGEWGQLHKMDADSIPQGSGVQVWALFLFFWSVSGVFGF